MHAGDFQRRLWFLLMRSLLFLVQAPNEWAAACFLVGARFLEYRVSVQ